MAGQHSIQQMAERLRWGVLVMIALIGFTHLALRFGWPTQHLRIVPHWHGPPTLPAAMAGDLAILALLAGLVRLAQMLGGVAQGELFSARVSGGFRAFAFWLLVSSILRLMSGIADVWLHIGNRLSPPRPQVLTVDFNNLLMVGLAATLFLVARLLVEAQRVSTELKEIV